MADIKDRAREYLAKNSEYSEMYGEFFVAVDTMTAMIEFAEQETKELKEQIEIDAKQIRALQKQNGELTDKVRELEQKLIEADNATDVFNAQEKRIAELTDELKALRESIKDYGAEFGYNKANEWHYVSEKGLPKESGRYFVYVGGGENGVYPLDFDTEVNAFGYWCLDVGVNLGVRDSIFETVAERNEDEVIAWKEILLPKESE